MGDAGLIDRRAALAAATSGDLDLLVIGGGITGACVARDAARRGLSVALIEKNDFAHATSAHNSKLIHGGLRYLRNFELGLVRESLRERRIWQRIAPHLVQPLPFLIPLYGANWKARAQLTAGLTVYDLLSFDRGWLDDPAQRLPGHCWLDAKAALAREPALEGPRLDGAFQYYDAQMYSPERLALECVLDAAQHGAAVANHLSAEKLLLADNRVEGASVSAAFSDTRFDIRAAVTLIAGGPWADIFLAGALGKPALHKLMRSKGIHLIVRSMTRSAALTVAAGGGHFFVLPWRGASLLGTTDTAFAGAPDSVGVTEDDIAEFLGFIDAHLPAAHLRREDVQHFYAGLRPLVDDGSGDTYDASRRAELIDHRKDGVDSLFSAIGGKWTTSRQLAETTTDAIILRLKKAAGPCTTGSAKLPGAPAGPFATLLQQEKRQSRHAGQVEHIARLYGTRAPQMLALAAESAALGEQLSPSGDLAAQIVFAMREEMALTLEDAVMRRTGIGQLGNPGVSVLHKAAALMAHELGWNEDRRAQEIEAVEANFRTQHA
jgi:glycerol-3-phosphate dehydrogenase